MRHSAPDGKTDATARPLAARLAMRGVSAMIVASGVAAVASLGVLRMTAKGIHLTPDSFSYVGMAHSLAHGHGYARSFGVGGLPPETDFPPLYPTLLSASYIFRVDILTWASWANATLLAFLTVIVAWAVLDLTRSRAAAVVASVLTCTSVPLLDIYTQLWSEPTFFIWELLSLWTLARYARGRRERDLYVAGIATSLAMLTRYAGLSLLLTGIVVLSSLRYGGIFGRLRVAVVFSALAALPRVDSGFCETL